MWLSYDNERSIQAKTEYAYDQGLAGVMTWSIDTDDFLGVCNGPKFPLLRLFILFYYDCNKSKILWILSDCVGYQNICYNDCICICYNSIVFAGQSTMPCT